MPLVEAAGDPPSADAVTAARAALSAGGVVGLPTDTVYGLAVDPAVTGATGALFALKGRPVGTALPVLVAGVEQADRLGDLSDGAHALARSLWPGGLTLVVGRRSGVDMELGGRPDRIGLRCPAHPVPLALCRQSGPLAATSANRHGEPDLASASEVAETFPGLLVLDGGECRGVSSTVVDATEDEPRLLRAGAVAWEEVLEAWG
ncbi:MAG TPA: L-threonylcarbamoyladenylate synthase [Acidimicrobiales bacterium]|nr:L-threonylcarbamoyladenylate synthase [Acidimicrobiales bacterium]